MKKVYFRNFKDNDFEMFDSIPNQEGIEKHKDFIKWGEIAQQKQIAFTCETEDGEIICCFGVNILWDGVGEIWVAFTNKVYEYKKEITINTRMVIDAAQKELNLTRLQAHCLADVPESNRFLQHYGFKLEGRMRKYNPYGLDENMYARIREVKRGN